MRAHFAVIYTTNNNNNTLRDLRDPSVFVYERAA